MNVAIVNGNASADAKLRQLKAIQNLEGWWSDPNGLGLHSRLSLSFQNQCMNPLLAEKTPEQEAHGPSTDDDHLRRCAAYGSRSCHD